MPTPKTAPPTLKPVTVRLPPGLMKRAQYHALDTEQSFQALTAAALTMYLDRKATKRRRPRR